MQLQYSCDRPTGLCKFRAFIAQRVSEKMQIQNGAAHPRSLFDAPKRNKPETKVQLDTEPTESFVSQSNDDCQKVFGSVGAMTGALLGRSLVGLGGAVAGGMIAGTLGLGAVALGVGAIVGLGLGVEGELKTKGGRLLGGLVGGVAGSALGWGADKLGVDTSEKMAEECKGFSVAELPTRLLDTNYTSHPKLRGSIVDEGLAQVQPGDVLITNNDNNFKLEIMQKLVGSSAHWTHAFLADDQGGVIDILQEDNTPRQVPLTTAFHENNHLKILRPNYKDSESVDKTLEWSREKFGQITYDSKFDLETKDAMYCQEYIFNALKEGAPEIEIQPRKALGLRDVVLSDELSSSQDMKEVWSTGSNFWLNWLSHFN